MTTETLPRTAVPTEADRVHADMAANESARGEVRSAIVDALVGRRPPPPDAVAVMLRLLAEAGGIEARHERTCPDIRIHGTPAAR